jgi:hypothetical protein
LLGVLTSPAQSDHNLPLNLRKPPMQMFDHRTPYVLASSRPWWTLPDQKRAKEKRKKIMTNIHISSHFTRMQGGILINTRTDGETKAR